jgi:hypothetical protein
MDFTRQSFVYGTPYVALAATVGATNTATILIEANADFELLYFTGAVVQSSLLITNWSGLIQINDSAANRDLFSTAIPFSAIVGTGAQPFPWSPPRLMERNSTLVITFTNNIATATTVQLSLCGNKLWR